MRNIIEKAFQLKFNTLIIRVNQRRYGIQLETHPEIKNKYYLSQREAETIINYAKNMGLEVIPELNTTRTDTLWGRSYPELMLNQRTYNPANPMVYRIVFDIMDEVINIFKPKYFHIGHDEIWGLYGKSKDLVNPTDKLLDYQAFAKDIIKIHNYLDSKGIQTMMWGDMLLDPDDFKDMCFDPRRHPGLNGVCDYDKAIGLIPKDIIIVDWHYSNKISHFPTVDYFYSEGFRVIGATWTHIPTICNFSRYVANSDLKPLGMIATTWQRFINKHEASMQDILYYSAEAFWNGGVQIKSELK